MRLEVKSYSDFKNKIRNSKSLQSELIKNPSQFLDSIVEKPPIWNKKIFMIVVSIVGFALLLSMIFAAMSVYPNEFNTLKDGTKELIKKDVNNFFVMIASASIGALAGLLAPSPNDN